MIKRVRAVAILALLFALASCTGKPDYQEALASGDQVRFSISDLQEGIPVFHSLELEGTSIDYFVLKIEGRIESYFDACATCYREKKGYRAEGDVMVCRACGQRFPMDELDGFGSCHPLKLRGMLEGDSYIIDKQDIIKGAQFF